MIWISLGHQRFPLRQGETTIGRSPYCSIVVESASASRQHAALELRGAELTLTDLGSRNGTSVNGVRISVPTQVFPGDRIVIGSRELFVLSSPTNADSGNNTEERLAPTPTPAQPIALSATIDDPGSLKPKR